MRDITDLMNRYRECSRNLWNVYFASRESGCWFDTFEEIRKLLFDSLVVDELFYEGEAESPNLPPPALRVVPKQRALILIERLSGSGEARYWGEVKDMYVGPDEITLEFVDYFDYSNVSLRDFQYYLCKILLFPSHPEYQGREALIQVMDGRAFHDEDAGDLVERS